MMGRSFQKKFVGLAFALVGLYSFKGSEGVGFTALRSLAAITEDKLSTILPGELSVTTPWWIMPSTSVRSVLYKTTNDASTIGRVNEKWSVNFKCDICHGDRPMFYVRAYGPAVVAGTVQPNEDGSYEMSFVPLDPGSYTVEVVLTYSDVPDLNTFPLPMGDREPYFEGNLLPGFPLQVQVEESATPAPVPDRRCTMEDLLDSSKARWKVVNRTWALPYPTGMPWWQPRSMTGIHMDYEYTNCHLPSLEDIKMQLKHAIQRRRARGNYKTLLLLFVGDSVMDMQHGRFVPFFEGVEGIETRMFYTSGGLSAVMDNALLPSMKFLLEEDDKDRFVLYNAGLHDIMQLCTQEKKEKREVYIDYSKWPSEERPFSCAEEYRANMEKLHWSIESMPAKLHVYQSTNSAWNLYGLLGEVALSHMHPFPKSPHMISHFNAIVEDIVLNSTMPSRRRHAPAIMDGFAMTAPRPDNREVMFNNYIGRKMVHPGLEVADAMVQVWTTMILDQIETEEAAMA